MNQTCISKNGSSCLCNIEEEEDIISSSIKNIILCNHSITFNIGIRFTRKVITLIDFCNLGYCKNGVYKLDRRPTCYLCNHLFNHLEQCIYFWGCILCFKTMFPSKRKFYEDVLLCKECSSSKLIVYKEEEDQRESISE